MTQEHQKPPRHVVGISLPLVASGTACLKSLGAHDELCAIQYRWDADSRVLDLENVDTPKPHRRQGYPLEVLTALVAALPEGGLLRAVGDHSCAGLRWMRRMLVDEGYQIHQNFWCFRGTETCARDRQAAPGWSCPVDSDDRRAQLPVGSACSDSDRAVPNGD
jgi:hypothetical protein